MYILFVDTEHQKQDAITHIAYSHTHTRAACGVRSVGHIGRSVTSVGRSHRARPPSHTVYPLYIHSYIDTQYTTVLVYYAIVCSTRILLSYSSTRTLDRLSTCTIRVFMCDPILGL